MEVDPAHVPDKYADRLTSVQKQVLGLKTSLATVANAFSVLEYAATGSKELLVLLQNSNELRPSGGFIGTYGAFTLRDGVILTQTVSSVYDIDGQLRTVYEPPLPVRAVNPRWYIRDANWFASFPESARAVSGMYTEVTQRAPDLVMAITPALVVRALELTGPVVVPGYTTPLTAENFVEVTQVETSVTYDRAENKPKKMLAEFLPIFLERLSAVVQEEPLAVLQVLVSSVAAKDIQLYSPNTTVQAQVRTLAWSGEVVETARDYLSIVSANLGGTKTDLELEQSAVLHSVIDPNGAVVNTLTLRRTNPLPDKKGLENKSFVRVLVPLGSTLLSSKGFSEVVLDEPTEGKDVVHPQAQSWQKAALQESADGTVVGIEAGKTFFGNWIVVAGGQTAQVELSWRLPYTLSALDRQSLTVQKQSGAVGYSFQYKLGFPQRRVLWSTQSDAPTSFGLEKEWQVTTDSFFGVVLSK